MSEKIFLWEVKCVKTIKVTKDFGHGVHRSYSKSAVVKELCKVFTNKTDALAYLYTLQQKGYVKSYIKKYYEK